MSTWWKLCPPNDGWPILTLNTHLQQTNDLIYPMYQAHNVQPKHGERFAPSQKKRPEPVKSNFQLLDFNQKLIWPILWLIEWKLEIWPNLKLKIPLCK